MRTLLLAIVCVVAAACATPDSSLKGSVSRGGLYGAATLASVGTFEYQVAPKITANAMLRRRAAVDVDHGRVSVAAAREVLRVSDRARTALADAIAADRAGDRVRASQLLGEADRALAAGREILEGGAK